MSLSLSLLCAVAVLTTVYLVVHWLSHAPRLPEMSELQYESLNGSGPLPDLKDPAEIRVGVVVPCFNEEERLPQLLSSAAPFLRKNFGKSWEILVVDDGSTDGTREAAFKCARELGIADHLRYCALVENRGKGGAVTHGMKCSRAEYILFADADDASEFSGLTRLLEAIESQNQAIAIGSRAHLVQSTQVIQRSRLRNFLMRGFHILVYWFGVRTIRDTQCGFKLYTREAARQIFPYMHTEGWIFDVETLVIAQKKGIPVHEIPISWHEVKGSKVDLARDSIKMAIDLVVIRFAYMLGIYRYS